jgi:hypothetical protein
MPLPPHRCDRIGARLPDASREIPTGEVRRPGERLRMVRSVGFGREGGAEPIQQQPSALGDVKGSVMAGAHKKCRTHLNRLFMRLPVRAVQIECLCGREPFPPLAPERDDVPLALLPAD